MTSQHHCIMIVSILIDYRLFFKEYSVFFIILRSIYRYISSIFAFFNINIFTIYKNFQFFLVLLQKAVIISKSTKYVSSKAPKLGGYPATHRFHHIRRVNTPGNCLLLIYILWSKDSRYMCVQLLGVELSIMECIQGYPGQLGLAKNWCKLGLGYRVRMPTRNEWLTLIRLGYSTHFFIHYRRRGGQEWYSNYCK